MRTAAAVPDLQAWRAEARGLLAAEVPPADVLWTPPGGPAALFEDAPLPAPTTAPPRVPPRFLALAEDAVLHRAPGAHALLYRVLWRITHGAHDLLDDAADPDVRALALRAQQVKKDIHKLHAFVRFREVEGGHHVAWYAPDHFVLEKAAALFRARFADMAWTILTPDRSITWDGRMLVGGPGVPRHAAPPPDELEAIWRTYYASTFNPARINPALMRQHMPARFWAQLPETTMIPALLAGASSRVADMHAMSTTIAAEGAVVPASRSLAVLRDAARTCRGCALCGPATQTVFGEGPADAAIVLVGEQPGDQEDLVGRPFVGPAGEVLDAALTDLGIPRDKLYVTNAVKHFRFLPRGKQRLHQRATADQIRACKPWVAAELAAIAPRVVVCLGATAALSLIGSRFRITQQRGIVLATPWAPHLLATHHPAAILRVDPADRPRYEQDLRTDLARAWKLART